MNVKSLDSYSKILPPLIVTLALMGCASGTPKIEAWAMDEETINRVRLSCHMEFPESTSGSLASLWANKRAILRQSRNCTEAAQLLADQAENRNKVIGN